MTKNVQDFLKSFGDLSPSDQHEVLVRLLRLPIEAGYAAPSGDELRHAAEQVFLEFDRTEKPE